MFIVWLLTGIWHGANYTFILWGLYYFILLVIEKYIVKPDTRPLFFSSVIWRIITILAVNFGWVMFNSQSWKDGIKYCIGMLGGYKVSPVIDGEMLRYSREYGLFVLAGILLSTPIIRWIGKKLEHTKISYITAVVVPLINGIVFLWAVSYILLGAHNPFIYFNF